VIFVVKFKKTKNSNRGPSSSLGIMSFNESAKSLIRLSPELVLIASLVFGIIIVILQML